MKKINKLIEETVEDVELGITRASRWQIIDKINELIDNQNKIIEHFKNSAGGTHIMNVKKYDKNN